MTLVAVTTTAKGRDFVQVELSVQAKETQSWIVKTRDETFMGNKAFRVRWVPGTNVRFRQRSGYMVGRENR